MNEERKAKLKAQAKKYAPYVHVAVSVVLAGVVAYYTRENNRLKYANPYTESGDWPSIRISPEQMENVRGGAIFKYRETRYGDKERYIQSTTAPDFSDDANEKFEKFKKTGDTGEVYE